MKEKTLVDLLRQPIDPVWARLHVEELIYDRADIADHIEAVERERDEHFANAKKWKAVADREASLIPGKRSWNAALKEAAKVAEEEAAKLWKAVKTEGDYHKKWALHLCAETAEDIVHNIRRSLKR